MKKRLIAASVILIMLAIAAIGTSAYFTVEDTAENVITTGVVDISVNEEQLLEDGSLAPYPDEPITVMPNTVVSKIVSVDNLGASVWLRIKADMEFTDSEGSVMELTEDELAALVSINYDTAGWTESDGWWYLNEALAEGASSSALFTEVSIAADMTNEYQGCILTINITAQGVQTANNGESVLDALGWPAEE